MDIENLPNERRVAILLKCAAYTLWVPRRLAWKPYMPVPVKPKRVYKMIEYPVQEEEFQVVWCVGFTYFPS